VKIFVNRDRSALVTHGSKSRLSAPDKRDQRGIGMESRYNAQHRLANAPSQEGDDRNDEQPAREAIGQSVARTKGEHGRRRAYAI
jgi:hypothetical protein